MDQGDFYMKANCLNEALASYRKARELDPANPLYLHKEAAVYLRQGKYGDYKKAWHRIVQENKLEAEYHFAKGQGLMRGGQYREAIKEFQKALERQSCAKYFRRKSDAHYLLGQYAQALYDVDKALELAPSKSSYWCHKGRCLWRLADLEGAKAAFDVALESRPQEAVYLLDRCDVLFKLCNYHAALVDVETLIQLEPHKECHWRRKALCHLRLGNCRAAAGALKRAFVLSTRLSTA
eukprot:Protomagalhaensia_sp_Gyna_25__5463@NODE_71_length_5627_cov_26_770401_g53_i0_p4_GENE_NODE_71_length_5627_cov_26_770401_g53_i0NODE_71_length_5627_cov_26_770401_g53_i0_p4_ORF_typecomplete_len237_score42_41TPR_16/PF13432_6/0_0013TPR_16/PF13432_6/5_1e09TPR_16/PF13432_6/4_9e08TPR_16/PF13432_6/0_0032TPR_15/PF13429_6/3_3e12TPR_15/PF13429_6/3_5e08TPR_9/PF13371_6/1_4TPR_9/PF13371_6/0_0012TPR_9/PF13371_6/8_4e07TPR_9/PF13371_6/6_6e06TPR_9/PF13371_6/8_4e06TPR_11/PF13414_6/1_9e06TPR_11/PF13414_6/0_0062TPR_11/